MKTKEYKYLVYYGSGGRQGCYNKTDVLDFIRHLLSENENVDVYIEKLTK